MSVTVLGADRPARALHSVADDLGDLSATNAQAARLALSAANVPRRTGELAGSGVATGTARDAVVTFHAVHAVPVHAGVVSRGIAPRPFAQAALQDTQPAWLALYDHRISALLRRI